MNRFALHFDTLIPVNRPKLLASWNVIFGAVLIVGQTLGFSSGKTHPSAFDFGLPHQAVQGLALIYGLMLVWLGTKSLRQKPSA
jgi:hypothetical protein